MQSESEARENPRTEAEQKKTPTNEALAASVYGMPRGIVRACAGVVEALDVLPDRYKQAVARAEESVGQSFDKDAVAVRKALVAAVKLSIINQKDWPYDFLEAHYGFAVSRRTFYKEKRKFCWALAKELGMI